MHDGGSRCRPPVVEGAYAMSSQRIRWHISTRTFRRRGIGVWVLAGLEANLVGDSSDALSMRAVEIAYILLINVFFRLFEL